MRRLITAALLVLLGAAQATPSVPHIISQPPGIVFQAIAPTRSSSLLDTGDDDEPAPPVPIHRANPSRKKPAKKAAAKKPENSNHKKLPGLSRPKRFYLSIPD